MDSKKLEAFHHRLRRLRIARGLTAKEFAQLIGVPVSTYREWEYGRAISGEPYIQMAKVFGVSVHELLTGEAPGTQQEFIQDLQSVIKLLQRLQGKIESMF